jgi:hypothetical protein
LLLRVSGPFCTTSTVLDPHGDVWVESGCEASSSGWNRRSAAGTAAIVRVERAVAGLPPPPLCPDADPTPGNEHVASLEQSGEAAGGARAWRICISPAKPGIPPDFAEAIDAMDALRGD